MISQLDKSGERIVGRMEMGVILFYGEGECMEWQRLHCTFTGSIAARLSESKLRQNRGISLGISTDLATRTEIYHRIGSLVLNNPFICAEIR